MLLLVRHLLQHGVGLLTLGAVKFANPVIVFWHKMCVGYVYYANILSLHFIFLF